MKNNDFNILVFSYIYPPDSGSGTYRSLYFFNHLAIRGVGVTVITLDKKYFHKNASIDDELAGKIHPSINVVRTRIIRPFERVLNFKNKVLNKNCENKNYNFKKSKIENKVSAYIKNVISELLTCPDEHVGWIVYSLKAAQEIVNEKKIDCIYATGGPWSCILAASIFSRKSKIPLVLDFRDPWVSNPNFYQRTIFSQFFQRHMESFCVKTANSIVANTEELRLDFLTRFPLLKKENLYTITNGFEELYGNNLTQNINNEFTIVHAGELYMSRNPTQFLYAIQDAIRFNLIPKNSLKIKLLGGVAFNSKIINELLSSEYLKDVIQLKLRINHKDAINEQLNSDVLLVIQFGFPLQIPRKLYEYISFSKKILAITENEGATCNIIRNNNLGTVVNDNKDEIKDILVHLYNQWILKKEERLDLDKLIHFNNKFLSCQLKKILEKASGNFR